MKDFSELEAKLQAKFRDQDLLRQSLVHRSYLNENPGFALPHNERLEFLGDAVLELIVTEYLYQHYENPEGELTNWRSSLVNFKMLGERGEDLDLYPLMHLSKGELKDNNPKARTIILANAYEAVVGAIYLDQGLSVAREFV